MKIIDGFQFFNELELLEIRLEELYDIVDYFVISECTKTHQNKPKKLYYLENKNYFAKFSDKIIHHVFNPTEYPYAWYIEREQRNEIKKANFPFEDGDIFLLSDADEIMKASSIKYIKENSEAFKRPRTSIMQMSYNYINTVIENPWHHKGWRGTVILPHNFFHLYDLSSWRDHKDELDRYEDSGWHFSFLGGAERVKIKLESYAHSEFNNNEYTNLNNITQRINSLKDPLGRSDFELYLEENLNKFPKSCLKFKKFFF